MLKQASEYGTGAHLILSSNRVFMIRNMLDQNFETYGVLVFELDEDVLFYLQSRGMDRESVYEMMAQAKLNAVIERIPVSGIQREARCLLGGSGTDAEGDREND